MWIPHLFIHGVTTYPLVGYVLSYTYLPMNYLTYQLTYLHTHLPMQDNDKEILSMVYLKANYGLLRNLPRLGDI